MRWSIEQVAAVATTPAAMLRAESVTDPARWSGLGADQRAVWGRCGGTVAEPYDVVVDHDEVAFRCTCPSRVSPCKHALGLLLMWSRDQVPDAARPPSVGSWITRRDRRRSSTPETGPAGGLAGGDAASDDAVPNPSGLDQPADVADTDGGGAPPPGPAADHPPPRDTARDDRVAKMREGLVELDRWLHDRLRAGLADPSVARYSTWDDLAARLVDARAGSLANRVRRLAGAVGVGPRWHESVLEEIGVLHLLAAAGLRVPELPGALADQVAAATGWQVRRDDVLAGVPETDHWDVLGRSDTREDRIEVRRCWLRGRTNGRWAMVLSFAAYRQSLDDSLVVGTTVHADLHRYPGGALRALPGVRHSEPVVTGPVEAAGVGEACDAIGTALAEIPWLDRVPAVLRARPARAHAGWVLTDEHGSIPLDATPEQLGVLVGASADGPCTLAVEWTPTGVVPLAVHLADRALDIARVADADFVVAGAS